MSGCVCSRLRPSGRRRARAAREGALAAVAMVLFLGLCAGSPSGRAPLPPILFVSRNPVAGEPRAIPGLGPHRRATATGGRLLLREPDGRVRPVLPAGLLYDVSDPAVSFDGRRVAFAGTIHPDSAWRIWVLDLDGGAPKPVTRSDRVLDLAALGSRASLLSRYDDLDPCWIADSVLCFASTRFPQVAQYADVPVTNLYVVRADGRGLARITSERNGAEEPAFDRRTGRIIYSRWWFNRYRASRVDPSGITTDPSRALPGDSVNLWQAVEIGPRGRDFRLAAGAIGSRLGTMAYQPAVLADGTVVGVYAANSGLSPRPGGVGIQSFPGRYGRAVRLAGATFAERGDDPYHATRGLAAPAACSPAGLPDGRVLFAYDPGARGDFGIFCANADGSGLEPVVDLPGTLELDPAPIARATAAERVAPGGDFGIAPAPDPLTSRSLDALSGGATFVFQCRNVFASGPLDSPVADAPAPARDLAIRFFAVLPRFEREGGDTAVLIREARVGASGEILEERLPANVPMFEQLVDRDGRPVSTAHGPAHVRGLNFGAAGSTVRCVGCHLGHSTLAADDAGGARDFRWINASPSAAVSASSAAPGTAGARAAVDRRTRGPAEKVDWIAAGDANEWLRLTWGVPLVVRELVLHAPRPERREATDLEISRTEIRLFRAGRTVGRRMLERPLGGEGTRVMVAPTVLDAVEIRILRTRGRVAGRRAAALAEVETLARVAEASDAASRGP